MYVRLAQADYSPDLRYHCKFLHRLEAAVMELGWQVNASPSLLEPTCLAMARRHTVPSTFKQPSNTSKLSIYTLWKHIGCSGFAKQSLGTP